MFICEQSTVISFSRAQSQYQMIDNQFAGELLYEFIISPILLPTNMFGGMEDALTLAKQVKKWLFSLLLNPLTEQIIEVARFSQPIITHYCIVHTDQLPREKQKK